MNIMVQEARQFYPTHTLYENSFTTTPALAGFGSVEHLRNSSSALGHRICVATAAAGTATAPARLPAASAAAALMPAAGHQCA
jgi:hypothetical protein